MVVGNSTSMDSNHIRIGYSLYLTNLKTCKMNQTEKTQLESRKETLISRHSRLCEMYHDDYSAKNSILLEVIDEIAVEIEKITKALTTKVEYLFNFKGGGWNSEFALTVEEAQEQAIEKYGQPTEDYGQPTEDSKVTNIDLKTFRVSTPTDYSNLLSLFH